MAVIAKLTTADITSGMTLRIKVARGFSLRMKIGCLIIRLAGRVMNMPCHIEMIKDRISAGDVVRDKFSGRLMTVNYVHDELCHCVWFESDKRHRNTFKATALEKAAA